MRVKVKKSYLFILLGLFTLFNLSVIGILSASQKLDHRVIITSEGFFPDLLTVEKGTTVTFINEDLIAHWPASNVHPTHDLYPEFDPTQPVETKKDWTFTANKVGSWKFHDHLFPHKRGSLIVREPSLLTSVLLSLPFITLKQSSPLPPAIANNRAATSNTEAYNEIKSLADKDGVEKAWEYIRMTYGDQNGSTGEAHDYAHFVGGLIFKDKGLSGLQLCTSEFAFGCYHGFLDTAFEKDLSKLSEAEKACGDVGKVGSGPYASCIHGIGHGVASFYNTSDLKKSLATCEKLSNGQEYCFDGVFMEFERSAPDLYKQNDPLYPCNSLDDKYVYSCGRNQPTAMKQYLGMDFTEIAQACLKTNNEDLKNSCFVSLGFQAVYQTEGNSAEIIKLCQILPDSTFRLQCTSSAAGELIFQNMSGWQQKAPLICQSLVGDNQLECTRHIETIQKEYRS